MKGGGDYQRRVRKGPLVVIFGLGKGGWFGVGDKAVEVSERSAILPII
jgi:hypothetical protein